MRSFTLLASLGAVACTGLALASCGGGDDNDAATTADVSEVEVEKPVPEFGNTPLSSGVRYRTEVFEPRLSLTLPDGTWRTELPQSRAVFALKLLHPPPTRLAILAFEHIEKVFDPVRGGQEPADAVAAPADFAAWLTEHPYLVATEPVRVDIGTASGVQIDVTVKSVPEKLQAPECDGKTRCLSLFVMKDVARAQEIPVVYPAKTKARYLVLDVGGKSVVVEMFVEPASRFEAVMPAMQKVLDTVEFDAAS